MTPTDQVGATGTAETSDVERIEADLARTRADLGRTVDELAGKLDVKANAQAKLASRRDHVVNTVAARRSQVVTSVNDASGHVRTVLADPEQRAAAGAKAAPVLAGVSALAILTGLFRRARR